jgi:hypothetical protein
VLAALAIVASLTAASRAEEPAGEEEAVAPPRAPAWAMLFQVDRRFTLRSFDRLTLALQRTLRPGSAVRLGIQLAGFAQERDNGQRYESPSYQHRDANHVDYEAGSTLLRLLYVDYPRSEGRLRLFWAAGPQAGFRRSHQEFESSRFGGGSSTRTSRGSTRATSWSAGIGAALGAEWCAARSFALLAEYRISAGYYWGTATDSTSYADSSTSSAEYDQRYFWLGQSTAIFGLAVRF